MLLIFILSMLQGQMPSLLLRKRYPYVINVNEKSNMVVPFLLIQLGQFLILNEPTIIRDFIMLFSWLGQEKLV